MPIASSSPNSERDERVFVAAFGMMDSRQDGEATAAFMRVRTILHRHGGGFRRLLERSHEAERLNKELGRQNAQLLRENAALHARDSRPASPAPIKDRGSTVLPAIPEFNHWDIGLVGIIVILTNYGLLGFTAALTLTATTLICSAFANWFSPIRFFAGVILGLTALGIVVFNRSASADAPAPVVTDAPAAVTPASSGHAFAATAPPPLTSAATAPPPHTSAATVPPPQTFASMTPPRRIFGDLPPPRTFGEPRSRHGWAPRSHCGIYRLQPGFTCPRSTQWRRSLFPDFGRLQRMRYD